MNLTELANEEAKKILGNFIRKGGKEVSQQQYEARTNVCAGCPHKGAIIAAFVVFEEGCTLCGCPLETKAKMQNVLWNEIKCPHPDGNKWEQIDKQFKK